MKQCDKDEKRQKFVFVYLVPIDYFERCAKIELSDP